MKDIKLCKVDFVTKDNFIEMYKGVPARMAWIAPEAYNSLNSMTFDLDLVFSDMYRSPASSAEAYRKKNGVAFPGYSGHNYGVSIDIDVDIVLRKRRTTYSYLCDDMIQYGWTPYQGVLNNNNYVRGSEDWHFNFIEDFAYNEIKDKTKYTKGSQATAWINANYPVAADILSIQTCLQKLKMYSGALDGKGGPLTNDAIKAFKRAWFPSKIGQVLADSTLDEKTVRLIHVVSANIVNEQTGEKIL
jgi:hypothetical protein